MPFLDRADAGRRLAAALAPYKSERPIVLALARGGVPVASEVAKALGAPMDVILVRKIGVPYQPELAMGAIVDGQNPLIVRNEGVIGATDSVIRAAGVTQSMFDAVCARERAEIERRRQRYFGKREQIEVVGRTVIVIDDGIATGATTRAALRATRARSPKKLVLAVPVAPIDALLELEDEADEIICLERYRYFGGVGQFYTYFAQVSDEDVVDILRQLQTDDKRSALS